MKILIVSSFNNAQFAPFITEQADALINTGCEVEYFGVVGKGVKGYLKSLFDLKAAIELYRPDLIHAHYGLCGLLANLQRRVPVITTYHGSDINLKSVFPFSRISMALSKYNIFVSQKILDISRLKRKAILLPCGVELSDLQLTGKVDARKRIGLEVEKKYVLFAGAFDNSVKNYSLAKEAIGFVPEAELIELKGYTRDQVTLLMCAVDCLLMTSHSEGSPQVIKEAMACGCPIVSVDVGDVSENLVGLEGCHIVSRTPEDIAVGIRQSIEYKAKTNGRERIVLSGLTNTETALKLLQIYSSITK